MKDHYKTLGLEEDASKKEIQARWIRLVEHCRLDPEKTQEADEKIKEINEAYEVLGNERARFEYDLERDLKRSLIKSGHRRKKRRINNIQKTIVSLSLLVLFLITDMVIYGWVHVTSPPKSVADFEGDKVSEEKTVFPISLVEIESKVKKRREGPKEVKKEDMPQESREIVSIPPQPSLSGGESESKEEEKSAENALHNSRTPGKVGEEVVTEQDPNLAKELVP